MKVKGKDTGKVKDKRKDKRKRGGKGRNGKRKRPRKPLDKGTTSTLESDEEETAFTVESVLASFAMRKGKEKTHM